MGASSPQFLILIPRLFLTRLLELGVLSHFPLHSFIIRYLLFTSLVPTEHISGTMSGALNAGSHFSQNNFSVRSVILQKRKSRLSERPNSFSSFMVGKLEGEPIQFASRAHHSQPPISILLSLFYLQWTPIFCSVSHFLCMQWLPPLQSSSFSLNPFPLQCLEIKNLLLKTFLEILC